MNSYKVCPNCHNSLEYAGLDYDAEIWDNRLYHCWDCKECGHRVLGYYDPDARWHDEDEYD